VVGLINNMPDGALQATERQYCAILSAASRACVVRLKLFSLPDIARSMSARAHIARYYEDIGELRSDPPDGLIVTGTEPVTRNLANEPYWNALSQLIDWTQDNAVPTIWSCLAAHAAALRIDGIERQPFGEKLSGLFDCEIINDGHPFLNGMPTTWRVPHSRYNGLPEQDLLDRGYDIVSWSPAVGADIFVKPGPAPALFFQGHPEYGPGALLSEFKRDVARFLAGERGHYPPIPLRYFKPQVEADLEGFRERAVREPDPGLFDRLTEIVSGSRIESTWQTTASCLYANWLTQLGMHRDSRRFDRGEHSIFWRPDSTRADATDKIWALEARA